MSKRPTATATEERKPFETDPVVQERLLRALAVFQALKRGDIVPHTDLIEIVGAPPDDDYYRTFTMRVRRKFEEKTGIATWPIANAGFRLLTVREQLTDLPWRRARKAATQTRRALRSLDAMDPGELTLSQANLRSTQRRLMGDAHRRLMADVRATAIIYRQQDRPDLRIKRRPDVAAAEARPGV